MSRILRIELRRSAAAGTALTLLVVGAIVLAMDASFWAVGWMPLARSLREFLVLLFPLALAAGAWQARREQRSNVAELFATTARPRLQRFTPTLAALAIAAVCGYATLTGASMLWIADSATYLPATFFAVVGVGAVALVAAVWLGLAAGHLLPSAVTAPALAVVGTGVLLLVPAATRPRDWLAALAGPNQGLGLYTDFATVPGRISAAQGIWLVALATAAVVLLAAGSRRTRVAALLPVLIGATAAVLVVPRGADWVRTPIDPVARELVCDENGPRVCVARVHAALLPATAAVARQGLTLLAKLPDAPREAVEDTTTFADPQTGQQQAGTALFALVVVGDGLTDQDAILTSMLSAGGAGRHCPDAPNPALALAVGSWLQGREPAGDQWAEPGTIDQARAVWKELSALPEAEAAARAGAVREAALACQELAELPAGGAR
ncbi:hypothetical protein [Actinoplanes sp. NPDC051494]|uniref:hypothetical protein n=1 Tax=Actinoplanes sp. NPDC051494 TaxID=3363907 RepID=UPI0037AC0270